MKKENNSKDVVDQEEFELIKVFVKTSIPDYQKCDGLKENNNLFILLFRIQTI